MLVLTRRIGESLMIGDNVEVFVLGVNGGQVRVGVNAPKDVTVHRHEIYQRILKERAQGIHVPRKVVCRSRRLNFLNP